MNRQIIAVDIDETLVEYFAGLIRWYNAAFGTSLSLRDIHPRSQAEIRRWGVTTVTEGVERCNQYFAAPEFLDTLPLPGAVDVLGELARNYRIVIVTARDMDVSQTATLAWLERHFAGVYEAVYFTSQYSLTGGARTKKEVLRSIGASYLIDDSPDNCLDVARCGVEALLYGIYPWNDRYWCDARLMQVRHWYEVKKCFDELDRAPGVTADGRLDLFAYATVS